MNTTQLEPLDLAELAAEVVQRFTDEAARVGSALHLHAAGPVPAHGDRQRLDGSTCRSTAIPAPGSW